MRPQESTSPAPNRRRFLAISGVTAGAMTGLAGCLGTITGVGGEPVANASPLGEPVDGTALSWDDLGDLKGTLTVYSGRTQEQIDPVFEALEEEYDGFEIDDFWDDNDVFVNQIIEEGDAAPADIMYSQDPGALNELHTEGRLQPLPQDIVDAVPESFREPEGYWTGVTGRTRAILYNSDRLDETDFDSWDDLPTDITEYATDDRLEGIISTRPNSGTFRGFIQAMADRKGETETREWVRAMVEDQDIQTFSGGSDQAEAINRGGSDDPIIALGNSYYAARILDEDPNAPIRTTYTVEDAGSLFSVAGVGVLNTVGNADLVAEFIRHLLAEEGQQVMMEANGEYPVIEEIDYVGELPDLDEIDPPTFDLSEFDMELQEADQLLQTEGLTV